MRSSSPIGFVAFGIGGTGGSGISDLFQNAGSATGGPSVGDAKDKIADGNLAAYKELADAYRAENKPEEAIAAGEQYVEARPKDYDFMRTLASDYEGQATRLREAAEIVQEDLHRQDRRDDVRPPADHASGAPSGRARSTRS